MSVNVQHKSYPTNVWIIDNFFDDRDIQQINADFYDFDDERWLTRNHTEFEQKRLSTHWDWYPGSIYRAMFYLSSSAFISQLEQLTGIKGLIADYGLHAGGMHLHAHNGRLNLHKDADLHPKLGLRRKLNIIIYTNPDWKPEYGGQLEFWSDENGQPKEKVFEVDPIFNRAVIFETDQNFWHGLPADDACHAPEGVNRESLALFYYLPIDDVSGLATRALFAPTEEQLQSPEAIAKIKERMESAFKYGR